MTWQHAQVVVHDRCLEFEGYGNPRGSLWFLGIEEGFGGRLSRRDWTVQRELDVRASWEDTMDARLACETLQDDYWNRRNYSRVWRNAAKLARGIVEDGSDWLDTDQAHRYVVSELGRTNRSTFLGELFPLPALGLDDWPYASRWSDRADYRGELWPLRKMMWQQRVREFRPRFVICYGVNVRRFATDLFDVPFKHGVYAVNQEEQRIVFAPFIGGRCSNRKLREVLAAATSDAE